MRKLKVYGWRSFRSEASGVHKQTREICAATSRAACAIAAGKQRPSQLDCLVETGNEKEIAIATSKPGTVFWTEIHDHTFNYREAQ